MKNKAKLRALGLLVAVVAVIAVGTLVYPQLSRRAQQENGVKTQAMETNPDEGKPDGVGDEPELGSADAVREADGSQEADASPETGNPDAASETSAPKQEGASQNEVAGPVFKRMATDFTAYDVDGNALRLSDYRGKPVIVNFFASWCGPCRVELPYFEAAYQAYGEQIEFLMVDLNGYGNDAAQDALAMIEQGGYTFPIRFDSDGEAALAYSVRSIPTTLLVAPDGELLGTQVGSMSEAMLGQAIATLLGTI